MKNDQIEIKYAEDIPEALYHLRTIENLSIAAGCTGINYSSSPAFLSYPDSILNVRRIVEFKQIIKTERLIEFGAGVTLSQIENLPQKFPKVLHDAVCTIANRQVRNIATIGGNVCTQPTKMTTFAPLLALDAKLVLRAGTERMHIDKHHSSTETLVLSLSQFDAVPAGYFLTRIKVPLEEWDVSIFKRLGPKNEINNLSASFVLLSNTQKNFLSDLRIAFCGPFSFRNRELESSIIGSKLPLSAKAVQTFVEKAEEYFDKDIPSGTYEPILKAQFINLLKESLEMLTD
ncbi:MAG: FAD binding domain-containing protein [Treponemataceae bacterium]|nr:FAD binding domain-containing protein [Treponemataceae bacterium]